MKTTPVVSIAAGLLLVLAGPAAAQEESRAIVEKAVKAMGGNEAVTKLSRVRTKSKGTVVRQGESSAFTAQHVLRLPGQTRFTIDMTIEGKEVSIVRVLNGDKAWQSFDGQTRELEGDTFQVIRERMHEYHALILLPLLKDKSYKLAPLGEVKVNDRPAVGVKVSRMGFKDLDLYFDKENGLPVKSACWSLDTNNQPTTRSTVYSDFKVIDGVKQPMRFVAHNDNEKYMEGEITEIRFVAQVDDGEFAMP